MEPLASAFQNVEPYKTISGMVDTWVTLRAELNTYPKTDGCFICGSPDRRVNVCGYGICKNCDQEMSKA